MNPSSCVICSRTGPRIALVDGMRVHHLPVEDGRLPTRGHLLIEPSRHVTDLAELTEKEALALGHLLVRGTRALRETLAAEHVYVFRINDKVPHLHFHLLPRYSNTPREHWGQKLMEWEGPNRISAEEVSSLSEILLKFKWL